MGRFIRVLFVGLCLVALAACQGTDAFDQPFDRRSDDAIVLIGMAAGTTKASRLFGIEWYPDVEMRWAGDRRSRDGEWAAIRTILTSGDRQMHYSAYRVPPGHYELVRIVARRKSDAYSEVKTTDVPRETKIAFDAARGQVTYIGDFTIDAVQYPALFDRYDRADAAAREALKSLAHQATELRYVNPVPAQANAGSPKPSRITGSPGTRAP